MRSPKATKREDPNASRRIPLTIAVRPDHLAFIESCVSLKEFESVDQLFDAALAWYRKHVHAVNAYTDEQMHKGYSRDEILESIECETVVTMAVPPPRRTRA
jgi:hypothetical protein